MKTIIVKPDSRNRILLTKIADKLASAYKLYIENNRIILEPIEDKSSESVHWLDKPENEHLLEKLKIGLMQSTTEQIVAWNDIKHKYEDKD